MATTEQMHGAWNDLRGQVKQQWGEIRDDDWSKVEGNVDRLVGYLQTKSGETREQIEKTLRSLSSSSSKLLDDARSTAQQYAQYAADHAQEFAGNVSEVMGNQLHAAERVVQRRPVESLVVAVGAGVLIGVIVSLVGRSGR
ncbi:hypothetical protein Pla175_13830 [Pirellulimonas nuda]|uniref:CsbD-like domain-containing protein n=1 Tax=Pirellulimonas nuda TaxID=2528009 RepID=A0A518D977_9BACT|nr:CsbD family protein [Pirellulimonas nuda]QDU88014.1 hypothetical protein Pla175_13830 [Pirellulimonas nuda]